MHRTIWPILAVWLATACLPARAGDWMNWRGPHYDGSAGDDEKGLPTSWSKSEAIAWKAELPGAAASTPVVAAGRVFLTSVDAATGDLLALCLAAADGRTLWSAKVGQDRRVSRNNMASPSPVTDGVKVWFTFGSGDVACFDLEGRRLWARNLEQDFGPFAIQFGFSSSPLLIDGKLIIPVLQNANPNRYRRLGLAGPVDSYVLAIDAATGKNVWKVVRPTDAPEESREAYTTPTPLRREGRTEVLVNGGDYLTAHDVATGGELWRWGSYNPRKITWYRIVPSAVVADEMVIIAAPRRNPLFAVRPGSTGDLAAGPPAWQFTQHPPDVCTPLVYQGRLYVLDGDQTIMTCLEPATGRVLWRGELGRGTIFRASPTAADGKIYCINEDGDVYVLAAGEQFGILAKVAMGEGPCRSSIVPAGGRLYIRTARTLYAVEAPTPAN